MKTKCDDRDRCENSFEGEMPQGWVELRVSNRLGISTGYLCRDCYHKRLPIDFTHHRPWLLKGMTKSQWECIQ